MTIPALENWDCKRVTHLYDCFIWFERNSGNMKKRASGMINSSSGCEASSCGHLMQILPDLLIAGILRPSYVASCSMR